MKKRGLIAGLALLVMGLLAGIGVSYGEVRMPRPLAIYPISISPFITCGTSTDSADSSAFVLLAHQVSSGGITYKVNTSRLPRGIAASDFETEVDAAFGAWDAIIPGSDRLIDGGSTTIKRAFPDGESIVAFGGLSFGAARSAGFTVIWSVDGSGNVTEADTILARGLRWSTNSSFSGDPDTAGTPQGCDGEAGRFDVRAVVAHEAGHWLGLAHPDPDNDRQTMSTPIAPGELRKRTPEEGDKCGLEAKGYGDTGETCP